MESREIIEEIDCTNYKRFLSRELSILHFFSELEMSCLTVLPIIQSVAEEFCDKILFGKINIENSENIVKQHNVSKVPSILVFKHGQLIEKIEKIDSEDLLRNKITCLL